MNMGRVKEFLTRPHQLTRKRAEIFSIVGFLIAIAVLIGCLIARHNHDMAAIAHPITTYIPRTQVTNHYQQSEVVQLDEEQLANLIDSAVQEELQPLLDQLEATNQELRAFSRIQSHASGEHVVEQVLVDGHITPVSRDLHLNFNQVLVPVAHVNLDVNGSLDAESFPLDLHLDSVIGSSTENGTLSLINSLTLLVKDQSYIIPLQSTTFTLPHQADAPLHLRKHRFHILDPYVQLSVGLFNGPLLNAQLSLSLSSICVENSHDCSWLFIEPTIGYSSSSNLYLGGHIFSYNLGGPMPLLSDLWLSPSIGYSFSSHSLVYGLSLGSRF